MKGDGEDIKWLKSRLSYKEYLNFAICLKNTLAISRVAILLLTFCKVFKTTLEVEMNCE